MKTLIATTFALGVIFTLSTPKAEAAHYYGYYGTPMSSYNYGNCSSPCWDPYYNNYAHNYYGAGPFSQLLNSLL